MNEEKIRELAKKKYQEDSFYEIRLNINCVDEEGEIKIKAKAYLPEYSKGLNPLVSQKDRLRVENFINDNAYEILRKEFGKNFFNINLWNKKISQMRTTRCKFIGITVTGWAVALVMIVMCLLK